MQRLASIPMCLFLTAGLLVSGCTSQYGAQKTKVNYYPQCYQPVNQLRQDENSTGKSTAAGAVGGALLGALIGGLATGKASGAVASKRNRMAQPTNSSNVTQPNTKVNSYRLLNGSRPAARPRTNSKPLCSENAAPVSSSPAAIKRLFFIQYLSEKLIVAPTYTTKTSNSRIASH